MERRAPSLSQPNPEHTLKQEEQKIMREKLLYQYSPEKIGVSLVIDKQKISYCTILLVHHHQNLNVMNQSLTITNNFY